MGGFFVSKNLPSDHDSSGWLRLNYFALLSLTNLTNITSSYPK